MFIFSFFTSAGYNTSFSSKYEKGRCLYAGDGVCLAYLVHSQHTVYFVTYQMFRRYQPQSLQRIHDDAVENIINLSPLRIRLLRMTLIVLFLVKYLSASHIKCVTFQYANN